MTQIDTIFFVGLGISALLGLILGFGRSLKLATGGIFGIIISVVVCFMLGGTVRSIPAVADLIARVDAYFEQIASFLRYLQLGRIVYYICFFFVVTIVRIAIVRAIRSFEKSGGKATKLVSRIFGTVFLAAFFLAATLLIFATIKLLESTSFAQDLAQSIQNSAISVLYTNNPIKL